MRSTAIVVVTFDGYSDLWDSYFDNLDFFWGNRQFKTYLINNKLKYYRKNVNVINTGEEKSWYEKVINGLKNVLEDNIILLFEDYYLGEKVDQEFLSKLVSEFNDKDYQYLRLTNIPAKKFKSTVYKIKKNQRYGVNLQAAIWEKNEFISLTTDISKSAWEIEAHLNKILKNELLNKKYYALSKNCLNVKNGVIQGKWYPPTLQYFSNLGFELNKDSSRKIMSKREVRKYNRKQFIVKIIPNWIINMMKPMLKKLRFKFIT